MYDIIYIGGGLNYAGAIIAAKSGLKVALIEQSLDHLGGTCLHNGCIPSKMFLHHAKTVWQSRENIFEGSITLNMQTLIEKKEKLLENATKAVTAQCRQITLIEGRGKVIDAYKVEVAGEIYEAKHIVIGTGSSATIPQSIAYDAKHIITSDEVLNITSLPTAIAIYGDGAIGLEMASFFAAAGSKVTLIARRDALLSRAHPQIQESMRKELTKMQIDYLPNHPIKTAKHTNKGVHITFEDQKSINIPLLLVATGREPNTDVIAIDTIKVARGIETDAHFESSLRDHYAIGDCNGKLQLAHAAKAEAIYVTQRILGKNPKTLNLDHVVKFIHTLPMSYAIVGENRAQLETKGVAFKESIITLNHFVQSTFHDANEGLMIVYADEEGFILGAEILAPDAEELIAPVAMALAGEMDASLAKKTILAHPTFSEALERAYFRL